jgi:hypothetical protein
MSDLPDVSLVVESGSLSLEELTAMLDHRPGVGSHSKGDPRGDRDTWNTTVWRENSNHSDSPLELQCRRLIEGMSAKLRELLRAGACDFAIRIDVAVYFTCAYLNLVISAALMRDLASYNVALEISGYPTVQ